VATLSQDKFVIAYRDADSGKGKFWIGDAATGLNMAASTSVFTDTGSSAMDISVARLTDSRFVIAFSDDSDSHRGKIMLWDTTTGSAVGAVLAVPTTFNTGFTSSICVTPVSTDKFAVVYNDEGLSAAIWVGTSEQGAQSISEKKVYDGEVSSLSVSALADTKIVVSFQSTTTQQGKVWIGLWDNPSSLDHAQQESLTTFEDSAVTNTSVVAIGTSRIVVAHRTTIGQGSIWIGDVPTGKRALGAVPSDTEWATSTAVGIALESGGAGALVNVSIGDVVAMPVTIEPMVFYYAQRDGSLTTQKSHAVSTVPFGWGMPGNRLRVTGMYKPNVTDTMEGDVPSTCSIPQCMDTGYTYATLQWSAIPSNCTLASGYATYNTTNVWYRFSSTILSTSQPADPQGCYRQAWVNQTLPTTGYDTENVSVRFGTSTAAMSLEVTYCKNQGFYVYHPKSTPSFACGSSAGWMSTTGACWYPGVSGASCTATCTARGGTCLASGHWPSSSATTSLICTNMYQHAVPNYRRRQCSSRGRSNAAYSPFWTTSPQYTYYPTVPDTSSSYNPTCDASYSSNSRYCPCSV